MWRCDVGAGFINLDALKPRCGTIVAHVGPPFSVGYKVDGKEYSDAEVVAEMCRTLQVRCAIALALGTDGVTTSVLEQVMFNLTVRSRTQHRCIGCPEGWSVSSIGRCGWFAGAADAGGLACDALDPERPHARLVLLRQDIRKRKQRFPAADSVLIMSVIQVFERPASWRISLSVASSLLD